MSSDLQGHDNADNLLLLAMHRPAGGLDSAPAIPPDQVQMIQNINSLISEVGDCLLFFGGGGWLIVKIFQ